MAKKSHNEVKVGITVLVALALTIYIVITLADWSNLFTSQNDISVCLPYDVGLKGLATGSPIYLGGEKIGQVTSTHIEPPAPDADSSEVYVYFTMHLPATYPLRSDCILAAESNMLGGQASLAIHHLGATGEILQDGSVLTLTDFDGGITDAMAELSSEFDRSNPESLLSRINYELDRDQPDSVLGNIVSASASIESLTAAMDSELELDPAGQSIRSQVRAIVEQIRMVLNEELDRDNNDASLAKVRASLDRINSILTTTDDWANTNAPILADTVGEIHGIATETHDALPGIISQVEAILENVSGSVDIARVALTDAQALIGDGREMVVANRGKIDRIVDDLRELGVNLRVTSREVRRAPWRLLYTPSESEIEMEAVVETTGRFVAGAERLSDLSLGLRAALESENDAVDAERIQTLIDELEETFGHFQAVEAELWDRVQ